MKETRSVIRRISWCRPIILIERDRPIRVILISFLFDHLDKSETTPSLQSLVWQNGCYVQCQTRRQLNNSKMFLLSTLVSLANTTNNKYLSRERSNPHLEHWCMYMYTHKEQISSAIPSKWWLTHKYLRLERSTCSHHTLHAFGCHDDIRVSQTNYRFSWRANRQPG